MTHDHNHDHSHLEHDCLEAIDNLYAYLDGELEPEEVEKFERHLDHCRSCFTRKEFESAVSKRIRKLRREVPDSLQNRLRDLIEKF